EALARAGVGRGADTGAVFLERPNNALEPLFRFHLALQHASIENLIEFRTVIETWTVQAAAELRQPAPLAEAEAALKGMEEGGREPSTFLPLDLEFHLPLARAAANPFAERVLEGSRMAIERTMFEALGRAPRWTTVRRRLVREHRSILEAAQAGEGMRAADLMSRHIGGFYDDFL